MPTPYVYPEIRSPLEAAFSSLLAVAFDFDGVFTDNTVYVSQEGVESVRCWRGDGIGLTRLRSAGVKTIIVSTETNPVVSARAVKLQTPCVQGVEDKARAIQEFCTSHSIDPKLVAFVGNDVNDIPAFNAVGLPIAVADAHADVLSHVRYRTAARGGSGAVREVCDLILRTRGAT